MSPEDRKARTRFFIIGAARLAGAITIALAVAVSYGRIDGIPNSVGYGLLVLGIVGMIVLPRVLAARWKSPPTQ
jgi:NCAIR mutase (PurE)-related protein